MKNLNFTTFTLYILMIAMASCVGTIEEGNKEKAISEHYNKSSILFDGVQDVIGISHNKVEVYFYPAAGGSGKYTYKIYYGGEPLPQVTSSDVINTDYRGLLRFTLTDLSEARDYIIRVDVEDQITGEYTKTANILVASTYDHKVADFYGISYISNLSGIDGLDSIKVRWPHAECIDALLCDQSSDPALYEIILLDKTNKGLTPSDFNNMDLNANDGRIVKQISFSPSSNSNEAVVRGLNSNTEYYVVVRSIHKGSIDDANNPRLRSELNNAYLTISTLNDSLSAIDFDTAGLVVSSPAGQDALSALNAEWTPAIGVFEHYRLYYAPTGAGLGSGLPSECKSVLTAVDDPETTILCKKINYFDFQTTIAGLLPQTDYELILVLCQSASCDSSSRIVGDLVTKKTTNDNPVFSGLSGIIKAGSISEFGTLTLIFNPVDLNTTFIDGYIVGYKDDPDNEVTSYVELDYEPSGTTDLYLEPYGLETNKIIVHNVEYYSGNTYCFKVFPYVYDSNGNKVLYENSNWKCINNPDYVGPTQLEFPGLKSTRTEGRQVTLRWDLPSNGVYENFEIYYVDNADGELILPIAISDLDNGVSNSIYNRMTLNGDQTQITLHDFSENSTYSFAILTHYISTQGHLRSDINLNIVTCTFKEGENLDCMGGR